MLIKKLPQIKKFDEQSNSTVLIVFSSIYGERQGVDLNLSLLPLYLSRL